MKVAICGGGRGGLTMAADLTLLGHEVSLFQLPAYESSIRPILNRGGIEITGNTSSGKTGIVMPKRVTLDPSEAVQDADIVMTAVPANGHEAFMEALVPHLQDGQIVVVNTGYWASLRFQPVLARMRKKIIMAETELLVYLCRVVEPGHVHVDATKREVLIAAMPATSTDFVLSRVRQLYPQFKSARTVLEINLTNLNPFIHTAISLLSTGAIENFENAPFPFYHNATRRVCQVIDDVDRERIAVGHALELELQTLLQRMTGMYGHAGSAGESFYEAVKSNKADQEFVFEPASSVFLIADEDIPYGLIPVISIADQLGIQTPTMRALVHLESLVNSKDYWCKAVTVENLGLAGMTPKQICLYAETGKK